MTGFLRQRKEELSDIVRKVRDIYPTLNITSGFGHGFAAGLDLFGTILSLATDYRTIGGYGIYDLPLFPQEDQKNYNPNSILYKISKGIGITAGVGINAISNLTPAYLSCVPDTFIQLYLHKEKWDEKPNFTDPKYDDEILDDLTPFIQGLRHGVRWGYDFPGTLFSMSGVRTIGGDAVIGIDSHIDEKTSQIIEKKSPHSDKDSYQIGSVLGGAASVYSSLFLLEGIPQLFFFVKNLYNHYRLSQLGLSHKYSD
jgi:hypothetical protein